MQLRPWAGIPVYLALGYLVTQAKSAPRAFLLGLCTYAVYDFTQPSMLDKIDLAYTKNIAERVVANANNSSNELNKLKKERQNHVGGLNSIDEDPTAPSQGGKRRRRNKTNRKNRNRKTRKNRRNRN